MRLYSTTCACAAVALSRKEIAPMAPKKDKPGALDHPAPAKQSPNGSPESRERDALKVPTDLAALLDGPSYVRAVAAQVDLVAASAKLVISTDEKIAKAELDRLRELIFGKGGPPAADETLRIDWTGIPRPDRASPSFTPPLGGDLDHF